MTELPEHVARNRAAWDDWAAEYVATDERNWGAIAEPTWGIWDVGELEAQMLPDPLAGMEEIALSCGTAYVPAWLARPGPRPVAIDNSAVQLETARRLQRKPAIHFPLLHGNAEQLPYPD